MIFKSPICEFVPAQQRLSITEKQCRAAYDYLISVPPFRGKRIPCSSDVIFKINNASMTCGYYEPDPHTIAVSRVTNPTHTDVLMTIAHEIVHLYCETNGLGGHEDHNEHFWKYAAQVCDAFGWKIEGF